MVNPTGSIFVIFSPTPTPGEQRFSNPYYRVEAGSSLEDYEFIPVLESEVPENLKKWSRMTSNTQLLSCRMSRLIGISQGWMK